MLHCVKVNLELFSMQNFEEKCKCPVNIKTSDALNQLFNAYTVSYLQIGYCFYYYNYKSLWKN